MALKFFTVAARDDGSAEAELNAFLRAHSVLAVDRRWVDQGADSFWSICVDYVDGAAGAAGDRGGRTRGKDYKELLSPVDFALFAKLRDLRKEIGQAEGVPVYTIFTNEQLAQMVKNNAQNKGDLAKVAGVGDARIKSATWMT